MAVSASLSFSRSPKTLRQNSIGCMFSQFCHFEDQSMRCDRHNNVKKIFD
ncbi:Uncharacterised protein [Yersinia intermedia]|nr:Uncharacterised protein [Yersinia intermedia]